jgi:NADPH:quinone reductase-like Zn-dependent oxidoreductase
MTLANKMALITGGNSGIGLATARLFLAEGTRVAIVGRNKTTLDAAAEALGAGVLAIQADVTDVEAIERAVATTAERLGKLDVVSLEPSQEVEAVLPALGGVRRQREGDELRAPAMTPELGTESEAAVERDSLQAGHS